MKSRTRGAKLGPWHKMVPCRLTQAHTSSYTRTCVFTHTSSHTHGNTPPYSGRSLSHTCRDGSVSFVAEAQHLEQSAWQILGTALRGEWVRGSIPPPIPTQGSTPTRTSPPTGTLRGTGTGRPALHTRTHSRPPTPHTVGPLQAPFPEFSHGRLFFHTPP